MIYLVRYSNDVFCGIRFLKHYESKPSRAPFVIYQTNKAKIENQWMMSALRKIVLIQAFSTSPNAFWWWKTQNLQNTESCSTEKWSCSSFSVTSGASPPTKIFLSKTARNETGENNVGDQKSLPGCVWAFIWIKNFRLRCLLLADQDISKLEKHMFSFNFSDTSMRQGISSARSIMRSCPRFVALKARGKSLLRDFFFSSLLFFDSVNSPVSLMSPVSRSAALRLGEQGNGSAGSLVVQLCSSSTEAGARLLRLYASSLIRQRAQPCWSKRFHFRTSLCSPLVVAKLHHRKVGRMDVTVLRTADQFWWNSCQLQIVRSSETWNLNMAFGALDWLFWCIW